MTTTRDSWAVTAVSAPDFEFLQRLCRLEQDAQALIAQCLGGRLPTAYWSAPGGACAARLLGGRSARLWFRVSDPDAVGPLLRAAHQWLQEQGVVHQQISLSQSDPRSAQAAAAGYRCETDVQLMSQHLPFSAGQAPGEPDPQISAAVAAEHLELFAATLQDSQDSPAVDRPAEDQWHALIQTAACPRLLRLHLDGRAVACLLLDAPSGFAWVVQYLGVAPFCRRRGLARRLLVEAARRARAALVSELTLAVTAGNRAAIQLYESSGFQGASQLQLWVRQRED